MLYLIQLVKITLPSDPFQKSGLKEQENVCQIKMGHNLVTYDLVLRTPKIIYVISKC